MRHPDLIRETNHLGQRTPVLHFTRHRTLISPTWTGQFSGFISTKNLASTLTGTFCFERHEISPPISTSYSFEISFEYPHGLSVDLFIVNSSYRDSLISHYPGGFVHSYDTPAIIVEVFGQLFISPSTPVDSFCLLVTPPFLLL